MFKIYLHPETCETTKPASEINFMGKSYPHYAEIRRLLFESIGSQYQHLPLRKADFDLFQLVHTKEYLDNLLTLSNGIHVENMRMGVECTGLEFCLPGYCASLGGMLQSIDEMKAGTLDASYVFSLVGHHSYVDWGHGYCLLNPQAVAVRYAQQQGFQRVLVIDWDIHHGDGTQAIFANDPTVHCLSIHSGLDLYMSIMKVILQGTSISGEAVGHTNIPLIHEDYTDQDVVELKYGGEVFRADESIPAFKHYLSNLDFEPDLITIFAGYDGHIEDCGDDISNWNDDSFVELTKIVTDYASEKKAPILSVQGGGYNLDSVIRAAEAHITTLQLLRI